MHPCVIVPVRPFRVASSTSCRPCRGSVRMIGIPMVFLKNTDPWTSLFQEETPTSQCRGDCFPYTRAGQALTGMRHHRRKKQQAPAVSCKCLSSCRSMESARPGRGNNAHRFGGSRLFSFAAVFRSTRRFPQVPRSRSARSIAVKIKQMTRSHPHRSRVFRLKRAGSRIHGRAKRRRRPRF
ncbi:hypothetical protein Sfum_1021 [Syntrophobacter fumaroxidans MPOB]|uniref:Uncharacterized protein n=1 Tax=Syntrophobacter fumaroxidans (strain DSM 10017 / MPOB) TaxID=335543 RepID=A0LH13_SYNFM|nr:hypothetical protein Sfum_1021 [Syntrophobacter fumaroxidans MPOB]